MRSDDAAKSLLPIKRSFEQIRSQRSERYQSVRPTLRIKRGSGCPEQNGSNC
jgi:hypothetical protein